MLNNPFIAIYKHSTLQLQVQLPAKNALCLKLMYKMHYFDRILIRANTRLMMMTQGQYELVRCKSSEQLRSQTGLELDVIDHYNGTTRSVKTSNLVDESFKASLSFSSRFIR